jgi:hypothetical protein
MPWRVMAGSAENACVIPGASEPAMGESVIWCWLSLLLWFEEMFSQFRSAYDCRQIPILIP